MCLSHKRYHASENNWSTNWIGSPVLLIKFPANAFLTCIKYQHFKIQICYDPKAELHLE